MAYGDGYHGGYGASIYPDGIRVEVDWDKDGVYTDETQYVRPNQAAINAIYGRDQTTALAPTVSGQAQFALDNSTRRFSSRAATLANGAANPLYGSIKPARPVKITRTINATDYLLFTGHSDDQPINPEVGSKSVTVSSVDWLADFRGLTISTPLYRGIRTGTAIGYILDAAGWSATLRSLDAGGTVIPWFWCDGKDALTALEEIIRSEGPPALLSVGGDGTIVFRDRHHRLLDTASVTSQSTWRGSGVVEPAMEGYSYNEAWSNIVNTGTASVDVRTAQELQAVWTSDDTLTFSSGEARVINAAATDPFYDAVAPVAVTDYTVMSGSVTTRLIGTSGVSVGIEITAGGTPAVITNLQLRARPVTVSRTVQVSASDPTSITDYGPQSFPGDLPWCGVDDAQAVLSTAVALRAQPLPIIEARFLIGVNKTKAALLLTRDLSDRVTIVEPETGVNGDFFIESVSHLLTGQHDHEVTFGVEAVPTGVTPMFRFDTTGQGFNDGKFGAGVDDSSTIFVFDGSSGHRFDEGVMAL